MVNIIINMKDTPKITLSIIIPAYNEAQCIESLYQDIVANVAPLGCSYEIIFIDDGSLDQTFEIVKRIAQSDHRVRGLHLSRNFGKESALYAGIHECQGHCAIVMDADGQHPPEIIGKMYELWLTGEYDIISGKSTNKDAGGLGQQLLTRLFYFAAYRLTGIDLKNDSDFKLLDRKVLDEIIKLKERTRFFRGLAVWVGFRQGEIAFTVKQRRAGKTKWSFKKLFALAVDAITTFTAKPLIWTAYLGVMGIIIAIIMVLVAVFEKILGLAVEGWPTLVVVVIFFGSMILLALGIIGIYLIKIYEELKGRQHYIISDKTGTFGADA